jgi:hypothetical protein
VDLLLNAIGALAGACAAALLERWGAIDRWSDFRARWFVQDARGALVLLALWPMALLFPAAVPFGLGQVLERLELGLEDMLADTPFLGWLPVRDVPLEPLSPGGELLCVTLGLLIPCLLGYCVIRHVGRRALFALAVVVVGIGVTALSAALSWGPLHAWSWLGGVGLPTRLCRGAPVGVWAALALAALHAAGFAAARQCGGAAAGIGVAPGAAQPGLDPPVQQTVILPRRWQIEDGSSDRAVHPIFWPGPDGWVGWLWPYAALAYVAIFRHVAPGAEKLECPHERHPLHTRRGAWLFRPPHLFLPERPRSASANGENRS